jgi:alpha-glucosidase
MKRILLLLLTFLSMNSFGQKVYEVQSPDGNMKVSVKLTDKIYYDVSSRNIRLLNDCSIQMDLGKQNPGAAPRLLSRKTRLVNETLTPVVPLKYSTVKNEYNQLVMKFRGDYAVEFRVFNDGIAHRFITDIKGDIEVINEEFRISFPDNYLLHMQQPARFKTAYEEPYQHVTAGEWKSSGKKAVLPILIDTRQQYKMLISESDLYDYPCMFFTGHESATLSSVFPKVPLEFGEDGDRSLKIMKEAGYIARTPGKRSFPWRYVFISREDNQLLENTMTYKLATRNQLEDVSWIRPGQVSWEWWSGATPYGADVNFVAGCNLDTYKYYIDFAAKYGIPYIIMDEGWAKSTRDPYTPNPNVDLHKLISYGKEKNVGIVLWLTWLAVENNFGLFKTFEEWGVKGIKIDFMDRSDQWMVNYYERVAREAAKHHLFVDFHGSFKPAGLEYKYPNVLSYEGVRGMEQMGGCRPDNSVFFPFIRNSVGPMDYTPGAMISMQPDIYSSHRPNSASIGTRAYQMALFVLFESGLQMLADNPTLYYRNEECTRFITGVPVTWDETVALKSQAGEYALVAKRKGNKWYIGGMTNNSEKVREFDIPLNFLETGKNWHMTSFEDGANAGRQAMDYRKKEARVAAGEILHIKMVRNGGFAAVLEE